MPTPVTALTDDQLVQFYIQLRDKRAAAKAAFTNADAADKAKQERIGNLLLSRFQAAGIQSVRTHHGTAYISTKTSATVADRDMFLNFVREAQAWDFLESRVNKTAVQEYKEQHQALPPGVNWREELDVNVRVSA
jgi:hypothetical protein